MPSTWGEGGRREEGRGGGRGGEERGERGRGGGGGGGGGGRGKERGEEGRYTMRGLIMQQDYKVSFGQNTYSVSQFSLWC